MSRRELTRRAFGRLFPAATIAVPVSRPWAFCAAEAGALTWDAQPPPGAGAERRYRADATVLLLSIPVLHRKGVGDGSTVWRESGGANGTVTRLLEFTGRSAPEHAAGLNRFGFIQELSRTMESAG